MIRAWRPLLLALGLLALAWPAQAEMRLLAPSSLGPTAAKLKAAYDAAYPGESLKVILAASSLLAVQMEKGLPGDVIITANPDWMDYIEARRLIRPDSRRDFLRNRLVLAAGAAHPAPDIRNLKDLPTALGPDDRFIMCGPGDVPCGRYARRAMEALGIWEAMKDRAVYAANAANARAFLERHAAPYGFLYRTDVIRNLRVRQISELPESLTGPIVYPMATLQSAPAAHSAALAAFLESEEARKIFLEAGFLISTGRGE